MLLVPTTMTTRALLSNPPSTLLKISPSAAIGRYFRKLLILKNKRWINTFLVHQTGVSFLFTLTQLSVFCTVVEGNSIFDGAVHDVLRILSFNLFSAENSVLITVKL